MKIVGYIFLREYLERVRSKAFIILTILAPLILAGIFAVSIFSATRGSKAQKLAIVDLAGRVGPLFEQLLRERTAPSTADIAKNLENPNLRRSIMQFDQYTFERVAVEPGREAEVRARLSGEVKQSLLDAYLWIDKKAVETGSVDYYARNLADMTSVEAVQRAASGAVMRVRLMDSGVPPEKTQDLMKPVRLRTVRVSESGEKEDRGIGAFILSFFFTMILYTTLILYGVTVMRGVIEEKTSRVFEVLLSSVKPIQLMAGKILGVAAVGLTQYLVWSVMFGSIGLFGFASSGSQLGDLSVPPMLLVFFVVYFILGYLLFSSMFAALGAAVNTEQEAQQLQIFIVQFLILPLVLQQMVFRSPASTASVVLSLIPFFSPILMFLRITVQMPPAWQVALSIVLMVLTTMGVMWICARIYRIGILMYGKRPTLPELWRWVRTD